MGNFTVMVRDKNKNKEIAFRLRRGAKQDQIMLGIINSITSNGVEDVVNASWVFKPPCFKVGVLVAEVLEPDVVVIRSTP